MCPPPRKSLVKGERFIRSEGRPELPQATQNWPLYREQVHRTLVGSHLGHYDNYIHVSMGGSGCMTATM